MKKMPLYLILGLCTITSAYADLNSTIQQLQTQWAIANYETTKDQLETTFKKLTETADKAVSEYPDKAEPLIWKAIIVSSDAGKNGGFGALGKVKQARKLLLKAEEINPTALNGSIYTSLGSLYYQVPGWPIGFGDDDKAAEYLKKALKINPTGIDANYFYADFLLEDGQKMAAKKYFEKALNAPDRPNRPIADKGRREEITQKMKSL